MEKFKSNNSEGLIFSATYLKIMPLKLPIRHDKMRGPDGIKPATP